MKEVPCPVCGNGKADPVLRAGPRQMVRCGRCRLVYRSPRPSAEELSHAFAEDAAAAAATGRLDQRRGRNFRRFLDRWEGPPGRLLDIGCGDGWFLRLARERGWETVGTDLSSEAVRQARERLGVDARCGELRSFRFPDRSFKLATLWNVLELVPDPVGFLQEIHRVLEPGGTLFIRTQNYNFQRLSFLLTRWVPRQSPYLSFIFHLTSFAPAPLRLLLRRTGFLPVRVTNSPPTWGDPYQAVGGAEPLLTAAKVTIHGIVQALYAISGGRWILGPSLEAHARREG